MKARSEQVMHGQAEIILLVLYWHNVTVAVITAAQFCI